MQARDRLLKMSFKGGKDPASFSGRDRYSVGIVFVLPLAQRVGVDMETRQVEVEYGRW